MTDTAPTTERRIEHLPLADLRPDPRNPKNHAEEVIDASVGRFGFVEPVVLDGRTGHIISGHGRTKALTKMEQSGESPPEGIRLADDGTWLCPTVVGWSSRTDAEAAAALIALNRTTELGGWVDDALLDLLDDLAEMEDGFAGVGFDEDTRAALDALVNEAFDDLDPMSDDEFDDMVSDKDAALKGRLVIEGLAPEDIEAFRELPGDDDAGRLRGLLGRD